MLDRFMVPDEFLDLAEWTTATYEIVMKFVDIAEAADVLRLRVQWRSLPYEQNPALVSVSRIYKYIPGTVVNFLQRKC